MAERVPIRFEYHHVVGDKDICLDVRAYQVGGIAVFYRDIATVVQAEAAMRHSHEWSAQRPKRWA